MSKNTKTIFFALVVIVLIATSVWYVSNSSKDIVADQSDSIRVGLLAPLTGPVASFVEPYLHALDERINEINNSGGVGDKKVELIVQDNMNIAREGVSAFRAVTRQDVDLVISTASNPTVPILSIAEEMGVPILATLFYGNIMPYDTTTLFYMRPQDDVSATIRAMDLNDVSKVGVMWINTEYGKANVEEFRKEAQIAGIQIIAEEIFLDGVVDFSTPLTKLVAQDIDALYLIAINATPIVELFKGQVDAKDKKISLYTNFSPMLTNLAYQQPDLYEGVYMTALPASVLGTSERDKIIDLLGEDVANIDQSLMLTSVGYDTANLIKNLFEKKEDSSTLIQTFSSLGRFTGLTGEVLFNSREVGIPLIPVIMKEGEVQKIE